MRTNIIKEEDLKTDLNSALKLSWKESSRTLDDIINEIIIRSKAGHDENINHNGLHQELYLLLCEFSRKDNLNYFIKYEELKTEIWEMGENWTNKFKEMFPHVLYISKDGQPVGISIMIRHFISRLVYSLENKHKDENG